MQEEAIKEILNIISISGNTIVIQKWGKRKERKVYELLNSLMRYDTAKETQENLSITKAAISTAMKKILPNVKPTGGQRWPFLLYSLTSYKRCTKCKQVLLRTAFNKSPDKSDYLDSECRKCKAKYRYDNRENIYITSHNYYMKNKEKHLNKCKIYYQNNKEQFYERSRKRTMDKIKATPSWYEKDLIRNLYKQSSKNTHIDHIIPLKNNIICGLHCFDNLQAIPAHKNLSKSNKLNAKYVEDLIMYNLSLDGLASYEFIEDYNYAYYK